jgi:hypothetical protein
MGGGTAVAATSSLAEGHDDTGGSHANRVPARPTDDAAAPAHAHGDGTIFEDQPMDQATRDALARELVRARDVALAHPTVAEAERAGYRLVAEYVPLVGSHYMNFSLVDSTFDPDHPEMLLYDGSAADSRIVGVSYYFTGAEPAGFAGPNDHWHRHIGLCVDPRRRVIVGSEAMTDEECRSRGSFKSKEITAWMMHAWVVPGWDSPHGVFGAEHAGLR